MIRAATPDAAPHGARILNDRIDATPWMPRVHGVDRVHMVDRIDRVDSVLRHDRDTAFTAFVQRAVTVAGGGFVAADGEAVTDLCLAPGARGQDLAARRFQEREGFVAAARDVPGADCVAQTGMG